MFHLLALLILTLPESQAQIPLNSFHRVSTTLDPSNKLQGSIPIDSDSYKASCSCSDEILPASTKCSPTKIKLTEDRAGPAALYESISSLLSQHNFTYIKSWGQALRCMDGRDKQAGISTPGGDLGEFALALIVFQDLSGIPLDDLIVKTYLIEWLEVMDSEYFYFCTDEEAVSHLKKQVGAEFSYDRPRADMIEELIGLISNSRNVGDSHLRLMLDYPQMYSIRPVVIKSLVKAIHEIYWKKEKGLDKLIQIDVLTGDHQEIGYLELRNSEECIYEGISPLIPKKFNLFINYIDSVAPRRKQLAEFFAVKIAKNHNGITSEKIFKRMNHHGLLFLDITGSLLAKNLPFYTALFI